MAGNDDGPRMSLLDVVMDRTQKTGRSQINRFVYVAKLAPNANKDQLGKYYEKFFKQFHGEADIITGVLMVFPACCLHLVEASPKVVLGLVRELNSPTHQGMLQDTKVLVSTEDIPSRSFPFWASRAVPASSEASTVDAEALTTCIADIYLSLLAVGDNLCQLPKNQLNSTLDNLRRQFGQQIPDDDVIATLIESESCVPLSSFIEYYDSQVELQLESQLVWPLEQDLVR